MFRAVVLSVAMTLALGPGAAAMCGAVCSRQAPVADGCLHTASMASTHLTPVDTCIEPSLSIAALARDEAPRDRSCAVLRFNPLSLRECRDGRWRQTTSPESFLARVVRSTPLRI